MTIDETLGEQPENEPGNEPEQTDNRPTEDDDDQSDDEILPAEALADQPEGAPEDTEASNPDEIDGDVEDVEADE